MKPIRILLVLFFSFQYALGQEKNIYLDTTLEKHWGDIHLLHKETQNLAVALGLQDLTTSKDTFSIRIWQPGAVLEISYDSTGKVKSHYINYLWKLDRKGEKGSLLFKRNVLPADSCKQIEEKVKTTGLDNLLESDRKKWGYQTQGTFYTIELATKNNYRFHTFCQVTGQDDFQNFDEYKRLQAALLFIEKKINYWQYFNVFYSMQEPGKYTHGAGSMTKFVKN